jgi:hypothetical protein
MQYGSGAPMELFNTKNRRTKAFIGFTQAKKFVLCNLLSPESGSGSWFVHKDPDLTNKVRIRPKRSGSDRIRIRNSGR